MVAWVSVSMPPFAKHQLQSPSHQQTLQSTELFDISQGFPQHLQSSLKGAQELAGSDLPQSTNKGMQVKHRQKHYLKRPFNDQGPLGCSTSIDLGWIICVLFPPAVPGSACHLLNLSFLRAEKREDWKLQLVFWTARECPYFSLVLCRKLIAVIFLGESALTIESQEFYNMS